MLKIPDTFAPIPHSDLLQFTAEELMQVKRIWWNLALQMGIPDALDLLLKRGGYETHLFSEGKLRVNLGVNENGDLDSRHLIASWCWRTVFDSEREVAIPGPWVDALLKENELILNTQEGKVQDTSIKGGLVEMLRPIEG